MKRLAFTLSTLALPTILRGYAARADGASMPVSVLYAGSLVTIMERRIAPELAKRGLDFQGEPKGSVALANLISSGLRTPDVFISADPKVIDGLLGTSPTALVRWYATFATTRLVIGYSPKSPLAAAFVDAANGKRKLSDVLASPGLRLGRTDPALDPKGYRSIIAAQLLEADGAGAGFAQKLLGANDNAAQIFPEETLLARLETGDLDAAFLYATEGVVRGVPFVELPATANLGDPAQRANYATASVTIAGKQHVGAPASYALTVLTAAKHPDAANSFVAYLLSKPGRAILEGAGVTTIAPVLSGDAAAVPGPLRSALGL
jgi:molybdate/tungstate transport system substrate-binding protein